MQSLIRLLFLGVASAFLGLCLYFTGQLSGATALEASGFSAGLVFFGAAFTWMAVGRLRKERKPAYGYGQVYTVELETVEQCLEKLGEKAVKLISDERWSKPAFYEVEWERPEWEFKLEGERISKPVLLNRQDQFQFSVANQNSKQEWHTNGRTFEIFVSEAAMSVDYLSEAGGGAKRSLRVKHGCQIVPPGVKHKVKLHGTTYVFQAMVEDKGLSRDREVVTVE